MLALLDIVNGGTNNVIALSQKFFASVTST